jgi:hypothetical protein
MFLFFKPFRPRLIKVCKKCQCDQNFFFRSKMQYGFQKMQNLMLISNPLEKLQKISCEKSYQIKSDRKMEFLIFITACKGFRLITFFGVIFSHSFQRIRIPFYISSRLHFVKKSKSLHPTVRVYPLSHNSQTHKACSVYLKIKGCRSLIYFKK